MLIACILSLRTQDTTTGPASDRLFAEAAAATMLKLSNRKIERLIYPVGFWTKARVILGICRDLLERFSGRVPTRSTSFSRSTASAERRPTSS